MFQPFARNNRLTELAAALVALVPANVQTQKRAEAADNPPAAVRSLDADLPKAFIAGKETFRDGTPIPKGEEFAKYSFDTEGRILEMYLPKAVQLFRTAKKNGSSIRAATGISYGASKQGIEYIRALTFILSDGREETYTRNRPDPAGSIWSVQVRRPTDPAVKSDNDFCGNFCITEHGELAVIELFDKSPRDLLVGPDGETKVFTFEPIGGTRYTDEQDELLTVRRSNGGVVTYERQEPLPPRVVDTAVNGTKTSWRFSVRDLSTKEWMWVCSDPTIMPSKKSPLLASGAMVFKTTDGLCVGISTTGSKTLLFPHGTQTLIDRSGRVIRVANGAQARKFIYDENVGLVGYRDMIGSRIIQESKVPQLPNIGYRVTDLGRIDMFEHNQEGDEHKDESSPTCFLEAPSFSRQEREVAELPAMPAHIHPNKDPLACIANVCPPDDLSRNSRGALFPTSSPAFGVASDALPKVSAVHSLSDIATKRGDALQPFVEFLRIWARTTTDEEIDAITCPEFLAKYRGVDGDSWISSELGGVDTADFLVWLRDCVNKGELPFSLDIKPLDRAPGAKFEGVYEPVRGATIYGYDLMTGAVHVAVELQSRDLSKQQLVADLKNVLSHGGIGLLSPGREANEAPFWALFHELVHAFDRVHGIERDSFEPAAHLGALSALMTITKEKAQAYREIFPELAPQR